MPTRRSIALCLMLVACGKSKDARQQTAEEPARAVGVAALPAETRVILGISVVAVASSPLARKIVGDALARDPDAKRRLDGLLERCHLNVPNDIDSVTIAMAEPSQVAVMARGHLDEQALLSCVRTEIIGAGGTVRDLRVGDQVVHAIESKDSSQKVWLVVGADHTLLAATDLVWLSKIISPAGERLGADTQALLARVDQRSAIWGVGWISPSVGAQLVKLTGGEVAQPAKSISFEVGFDKGLAVQLRLDMASTADAEHLAKFARSQLDLLAVAAQRYGLGQLTSKTQITNEDASLKLAVRLDDAELRRLETALINQKEPVK